MEIIIDKITYNVNRGVLKAINEFKELAGEDLFEKILHGFTMFNLSFNESEYVKLLNIILEDKNLSLEKVPYHHAEKLVVFFCEPFAGKYLKLAKYTLDGIYSFLQNQNKETIEMLMEYSSSLLKNNQSTDV